MLLTTFVSAQSINTKLQDAYKKFEVDSQLRHAISSLYVIDAQSGEVVFDKNSQVGLAPASTQKIITSVTAYELLGKDFRYNTSLVLDKYEGNNILYFIGNGDPTFGSWRWPQTSEHEIKKRWVRAIQAAGLKKIDHVIFPKEGWDHETTVDGWIWQDIGNYYGAGSEIFNWRENQFDIVLRSGDKIGDKVEVVKTIPYVHNLKLESRVVSAAKGTGDNAYVYFPLGSEKSLIRGTIPVGESHFVISAALPSGSGQFIKTLFDTLKLLNIKLPHNSKPLAIAAKDHTRDLRTLEAQVSPPLDSIIYWFNKRSINLYGEALIKTIGKFKTGVGSTDTGVALLKRFWKEKGINEQELNMYDGSGLSPLNRVTTHAQVEILKYAKTRDWYPSFYHSLPIYNEMHIKSGTISDVKGFCGYHRSKDGREYIFSFLVNNYSGRSSALVNKMYKVLDTLK